MSDETKKSLDFVQKQLQDALQDHLGRPITKDTADDVKSAIQQMLDKLSKDTKYVVSDVDIVGDTIKYKLQQPSFASQIIPVLKGPFTPWFEDGMVHVAGLIGNVEVLICTYNSIKVGGYGHPDLIISCLECLTMNKT